MRKVNRWYRLAHDLQARGVPVVPKLISYAVRFVFGYGGVVVHGDTTIGRGCSIGQNMTIGGGPSADGRSLPKLGENDIDGASVLGG